MDLDLNGGDKKFTGTNKFFQLQAQIESSSLLCIIEGLRKKNDAFVLTPCGFVLCCVEFCSVLFCSVLFCSVLFC